MFSFFFIVMVVWMSPTSVWAKTKALCEHVTLQDGNLKLNQNEEVLICGSSKSEEGWKDVPLIQAEFHLRAILQNLGYLEPQFEQRENHLYVTMGPITRVRELKVDGADGILRPWKKRKIVRFPMMTSKLNEVDAWANTSVRSQGYACPNIAVTAQAWDQTIIVKSNLGSKKVFGAMEDDGLDKLDRNILERYRPFEPGEDYDIRKPQLMVTRMLADGLFQSAYFTTECVGDEARLRLTTSVGKPKILRFGIGASTEEFPFIDASFRNARLDDKASFFTTTTHASTRKINLALGSELYWIPGSDRTFFGPRFKAERLIEDSFETNTVTAGGDLGRNWDLWSMRIAGRGGPTLNYTKTVRGTGPSDTTYPTVEASISVNSHLYESSIRDQYEGWTSKIFYRGQSKGLGSDVNVNRYRIEFKKLWNIGHYAPPLFVLGTRLEAVTVDANELTQQNRNLLPVDDRVYMGGDENLRGFPRNSLNNQDLGYLTSLYAGFELRLIEELPYHIQPFLLWDGAQLGNRRYTVDEPIYISQGAGVRWASPFGTLRASAAQGRIFNRDETARFYREQWVYFVSFGQEF